MGYANFKDPIGLLKRMLFSKNRVAHSVLLREAMNKLLVPIDVLMQPMERRLLKKSKKNTGHPIILVLGGSRSGTTLLYQTLVRHLNVGYINNFIAAFERSPLSAYKLFNGMLSRPKGGFKNYFGSVAGSGGPNDAFGLWNRWLGDDRNRIQKDMASKSKSEMKKFFETWLQVSGKAFLNKNNRNSLCSPLLDDVLDNILFVEIHRDPVYVAQSLVLSRRTVQGSDKLGWGLLAEDSEDTGDPLQYIDDICKQVYRVDMVIAGGRQKIDSQRYTRIAYEDFCERPADIVHEISRSADVAILDAGPLADLQFSTASNGQRLEDEEFSRIQHCIKKLYGRH